METTPCGTNKRIIALIDATRVGARILEYLGLRDPEPAVPFRAAGLNDATDLTILRKSLTCTADSAVNITYNYHKFTLLD